MAGVRSASTAAQAQGYSVRLSCPDPGPLSGRTKHPYRAQARTGKDLGSQVRDFTPVLYRFAVGAEIPCRRECPLFETPGRGRRPPGARQPPGTTPRGAHAPAAAAVTPDDGRPGRAGAAGPFPLPGELTTGIDLGSRETNPACSIPVRAGVVSVAEKARCQRVRWAARRRTCVNHC